MLKIYKKAASPQKAWIKKTGIIDRYYEVESSGNLGNSGILRLRIARSDTPYFEYEKGWLKDYDATPESLARELTGLGEERMDEEVSIKVNDTVAGTDIIVAPWSDNIKNPGTKRTVADFIKLAGGLFDY